MERSVKFSNTVFRKYYKEEIIDHYDDCYYVNSSVPINECRCDCYDEQLFNLGRKAQIDIFYNHGSGE